MKICIIGYTGFVGSAVCNYFNNEGFDVVGINSSTKEYIRQEFDVIINCAGNSIKFMANKEPSMDFEKNVGIFKHILKLKSKHFIQVSSVDAGGPLDHNYTRSKLCSEYVAKTYFPKTTIVRLGGLVGIGLKKNVVYDILNNRDLFITFNSTLNFVHTKEIAKIIHEIIKNNIWNKIIDVAASNPIKVSKIISIAKEKGIYYTGKEGKENQDYKEYKTTNLKSFFSPRTSEDYIKEFMLDNIELS